MKVVIDTNVTIAANGKDTHAGADCQLKCIQMLEDTYNKKNIIFLDDSELIFSEYSQYLSYKGQPGVGDIFFKYLHDQKYSNDCIQLVKITPGDDRRGFLELPENNLDRSDQKFLAVAKVTGSKIINALDTDWSEQSELLANLELSVKELCSENLKKR